MLLTALIRACKLHYNTIQVKLPIRKGLLHILINTVDKIFVSNPQPYLQVLYKALFVTAYYSLLRIGEVAKSKHVIRAENTHIGKNKNKILFLLRSSKTHGLSDKLQIIKIDGTGQHLPQNKSFDILCPFMLIKTYLQVRKSQKTDEEQFFIFKDCSPVTQFNVRNILHKMLIHNNFDSTLYSFHGIRAGRATDLMEMGVPIDLIKKLRRWKSSSIYTYLRT